MTLALGLFMLCDLFKALVFVGLLPGEHGVVSLLQGVALGQFSGRHVAKATITATITAHVFPYLGNVLVASHVCPCSS